MSGKTVRLNAGELETIGAAAAELDGVALDLRMSSSLGGRGIQWDEKSDEASYVRLRALVAHLYAIRDRAA